MHQIPTKELGTLKSKSGLGVFTLISRCNPRKQRLCFQAIARFRISAAVQELKDIKG